MGLHRHRWTWAEPLGLPGQIVRWCQDCGLRKPPDPQRPRDTRYRIEYVETKALIALLQAAHDYAAANEHRADYWTCMAAYLQAEGLSYRYDPPRGPIDWDALIDRKEVEP